METGGADAANILVAPAPHRLLGGLSGQRTRLEFIALPPLGTEAEDEPRDAAHLLEHVHGLVQACGAEHLVLGEEPDPERLARLERWHATHHYLARLEWPVPKPPEATKPPCGDEASGWVLPRSLSSMRLPPIRTLLGALSGPTPLVLHALDLAVSRIDQWPQQLRSHAFLAALARAGGVNLPVSEADSLPDVEADTPPQDPQAATIEEFRTHPWRRREQHPSCLIAIGAGTDPVEVVVDTADAALSTRSVDVEVTVVEPPDAPSARFDRVYGNDPRVVMELGDEADFPPAVVLIRSGTHLGPRTLSLLERTHQQQRAGLVLVTAPGDDETICAASVLTGAWHRAAFLARHGEGLLSFDLDRLQEVMTASYRVWWVEANDVDIDRPGVIRRTADLLDGTSAPPRGVLAEIEKLQRRFEEERRRRRGLEKELRRLESHPLLRTLRKARRVVRGGRLAETSSEAGDSTPEGRP